MDELKRLTDAKFKTRKDFAKAVGISEQTLSKKLKDLNRWQIIEVWKAADILEIPDDKVRTYFFDAEVANKANKRT